MLINLLGFNSPTRVITLWSFVKMHADITDADITEQNGLDLVFRVVTTGKGRKAWDRVLKVIMKT